MHQLLVPYPVMTLNLLPFTEVQLACPSQKYSWHAHCLQGFGTILMDLLTDRIQEPGIMSDTDPHLITYSSDVTFQSVMCLPSTLLKLLSQAQLSSEDKHRFAQHVFLPCAENLIADSRHCLDQLCVRGTAAALLTMPKANICMLGTLLNPYMLCSDTIVVTVVVTIVPEQLPPAFLLAIGCSRHMSSMCAGCSLLHAACNDCACRLSQKPSHV